MIPQPKCRFLLILASLALAAAVGAVAHAQEAPEPTVHLQPTDPPAERDERWRRVGPELTALHELYQQHLARGLRRPFEPADPFVQVRRGTVVIEGAADGSVGQLAAALEKLGAQDVAVFKRMVSARLPLSAIPELADVEWLRFARPARTIARVGATDSQGDAAMNSDDARTTYSVDGGGVTIGVLSDTFDCGAGAPGSYATDMGTGDLPAGIEVLDDTVPCGIDEGRAMLQLIHDVAPGSELSFHTAFGGAAAFALGIQELAGCPPGSEVGCVPAVDPAEVIVDDVGDFGQPFFQDGIIAQAADLVADAGVPYFSSAGNSGRASWEGGPFLSSGISPPGYPFGPGDAHDFDAGAGVDIYQSVLFPAGSTLVSFQWDEPFFSVSGAPGSTNEVDICVYPEPPPGAGPLGCVGTLSFGGDAVEVFAIGTGAPTLLNFAVVKNTAFGGPDPGFMKYIATDDAFSVIDPYPMALASTTFGHPNAEQAIGVGAAFYFVTPPFGTDPQVLEPFSSAGGTPILFDVAGTPLVPAVVREKPEIVAPDGTNTTFFGSDIADPGDGSDLDTFPNFFGTSAASPHAAAVAALMLDASPGLTPSGVEDVLTSSAVENDIGPAGFDFDSGFGLIDGLKAVGSVDSGTSCDGVADLVLMDTPNSAPGTFSAVSSITYGDGAFNDIDAFAATHIFADGFESGDTSAWNNCP